MTTSAGSITLSEFLGYEILEENEMLHDYYVRRIEVNTENDYIGVEVSYDAEGTEEGILTFHITGSIEAEVNFDAEGFLYMTVHKSAHGAEMMCNFILTDTDSGFVATISTSD